MADKKPKYLRRSKEFYVTNGSKGGKKITEKTKKKGFASMTPERLREVGLMGRVAPIRKDLTK